MIRSAHVVAAAAAIFLATFSASPAFAADPDEIDVKALEIWSDTGVLVARSADGSFQWRLDGRIFIDTAFYLEGDNELANGMEIRKARLGVKAILRTNWASEFELGFKENEVDVKDMWIAYVGLPDSEIKIGQHREPFSLEEVISSQHVTFMERSLINVFAPGRTLGVSYTKWGESWRIQGGIFGQELGDGDRPENLGEDEGVGFDGRFSWAPLHDDGRVLHLGIAATHRSPNAGSEDSLRFSIQPETYVSQAAFLDTGVIGNVDDQLKVGLEAAAVIGPFSVQGEYVRTDIRRHSGFQDASLDGWYVFATLILTGGTRPYEVDEGEFANPLPEPHHNAIEIAARYSTVDLNDLGAGVTGGKSEAFTLGLNYYLRRNIKLMLNFGATTNDDLADGNGSLIGGDELEFVQARLQLMF